MGRDVAGKGYGWVTVCVGTCLEADDWIGVWMCLAGWVRGDGKWQGGCVGYVAGWLVGCIRSWLVG